MLYVRYTPIILGGGGGGGGSTSPGGSNGDIQYNASGTFGGDTATTDGSGNISATTLTTSGNLTSQNEIIGANNLILGAPAQPGQIQLNGSGSGTITIAPQVNAGTFTFQLPITAGTSGQLLTSQAGSAAMTWTSPGSGGIGTVTSVSVVSANGLAGTVATATTTPAITLSTTLTTPVIAGNGTALIAATTTGTGNTVALAAGPTITSLNAGSTNISNVTDPTTAQQAATKAYVDASVAALQPLTSVYAASTTTIAGTYNNGASGIGSTFTTTATTNFALDGVSPPVNQRVLIKDQSSGFQNGVYQLTTQAVGGVSGAILTRTSDYNTAAAMNAAGLIPVINGTVNALSSWQQTAIITTVGTDSLIFMEFTANPSLYLLKANNLSDVANKTTSFNNLSPMTTGGDLIYGGASGTGTRLANGNSGQVLTSAGTTLAPTWTTPTTGTVTSVGAAGPTGIATWSSAVTTSGTLTQTLSTQSANTVLAGPTTGSAATPAFRSLVFADLPAPIIAKYRISANRTIDGTTRCNFDTQIYDTNSAVTTGASWVFTAPRAGYYMVNFTGAQASGGGIIQLLKNGVAFQNLCLVNATVLQGDGAAVVLLATNDTLFIQTSGGSVTLDSANSGIGTQISINSID